MLISVMAFPPGVRAPLTTDNENDHSGLIVVITSFFLVLTLGSLSARVFSSYRKRIVQYDDYVFVALVVFALIQASVVLVQAHYGWGTGIGALAGRDRDRMLKTGYAADILSILVLGFSKIATCLFYEALFYQMQRRFIRGILATTIIWTIISVLLLAARCSNYPWEDISNQCAGLFPRWQTITALDIITEMLLILFSGFAIHNVKIAFKKQLMVFLALGCRIVLIPLAALRLHYTKTQLGSTFPALTGAYATTTTEIYLSLSVVCQITSSMKFIIAVYEDKDGVSYTDGSSRSTHRSKNPVSTEIYSHKSRTYSAGSDGGDRERLVDAGGGGGNGDNGGLDSLPGDRTSGGLHIFRSVQICVQDEGIELPVRMGTRGL
ncbi:hypothetical protein BJX61DRAFT_552104 [Aspergillus egyptiacus]|nr:hypothetical protein BJX61DRAFT_552104 [Aspergillus egyptiacus]